MERERAVVCRWASVETLCAEWSGLWELLAPEERERAARFVVEAPRRRFVAGRALLRTVLAASTGQAASELDIAADGRGRPYLVGVPENVFNVSHSGDRVVVVSASGGRIGVDVEELRPIAQADHLARRFFAPREADAVLSADGARRDHIFLHVWTCKEAWLKAVGLGITVPLRAVEVDPNPSRPPRLVGLPAGAGEASRWSLADVDTGDEALCRIAVEGGMWDLDPRQVRRLDDVSSRRSSAPGEES